MLQGKKSVRSLSVFALVAVLALVLGTAHAQTGEGGIGDARIKGELEQLLSVGEFSVQNVLVPDVPASNEQFAVQLGDETVVIDAQAYTIVSADARVRVQQADGEFVESVVPEFWTYRGEVVGYPGSHAHVFIGQEREFHAMIQLGDGDEWHVQPVPAGVSPLLKGFSVVYKTEHVIPVEGECGTVNLDMEDEFQDIREDSTAASGADVFICDISVVADREYYQLNGSNETTTTLDMLLIIARTEDIYYRDVDIRYEVNDIVIFTAEPDPFSTTDPGALLGQFRAWGNSNLTGHDVAHLFTGKNIAGSVIGIASLGAICTTDRYGLSQSRYTSNISLRTSLTAHELGHNWSGQHCSGGDCRIMCPSNGGCTGDVTRFGALAQAQIRGHRNSRTCLTEVKSPIDGLFDQFGSLNIVNWVYRPGAGTGGGAQNEISPPNSLNLDAISADNPDEIRSNWVDLSGIGRASTTFWTQHRGVPTGVNLFVEYWGANNRWNPVATVSSDGTNQDWFRPFHFEIPATGRNAEFRLRFRNNCDSFSEDWYVEDCTITPQDIEVSVTPDAAGAPPGSSFTFDASVTNLLAAANAGEAWISVFNADFSPFYGSGNPRFGPKSFGLSASQTKAKNNIPLNIPGSKTPGSIGYVYAFVGDETTGEIQAVSSFSFLVQ